MKNMAGRFWSKVSVTDDLDQCWEWRATRHKRGYGCFRIGKKWFRASRIAWELSFGPIPCSIGVLHRCDNPPCCNPRHLFLGTQADNVADMTKKGRRYTHVGEKHGRAILNEQAVKEIKIRLALGELQSRLAAEFNVGLSTIHSIKIGETWKHIS